MRPRLHTFLQPAGGAPSCSASFPGICRTIHPPVLFPKPTFAVLATQPFPRSEVPETAPQLWTFNPESPDETCSKTRALLRCLPALLPEPSASGPRLRGIHCQSCSSGPATQRRSQKRWRLEDQRARTLVRRRGPLNQKTIRGGTGFLFFFKSNLGWC